MRIDYTYNDYDSKPDPSHRPLYLAAALKYLRTDDAVRTIIDAGCGGGDFSEGLALQGYEMFGVDLNESAVRAALARNVGEFVVSSVYEDLAAPFRVEHFDAAVCIETLEHLYSPRLLVKRVHGALRPGGIFIVTTPYWGYLKNVALAITNRTDKALTALWDGGHIKHFSRDTLTRLVTEENFEEIGFRGCGHGYRQHLPYLWEGMIMAFRKKAP
jgi:2-polyprenyl-6-hydroxyphenyl methylase/3-demethylubiquinone-9 3-methyltransferase